MKKLYLSTLALILLFITFPSNQTYSAIDTNVNEADFHKSESSLKILTWNIYMLPYCSLINGNYKRAKGIAKELLMSDYDIVVFEEAFDYNARKILKEQLNEKYPYKYGPANDSFFSFRTSSGLWVLSSVPLMKLKEIRYKTRYGIDALARKGAVLFEGEWQGQTFQLAATHLQADSPDSIRREQCQEISYKLLNKYAKINVPQIICGDFNIEIDDKENYQFMLKTLDAQNGILDGDIHVSFDEIDNQLAKRENGKKRLIDYVLIRNNELIKEIKRRVTVIKEFRNNLSLELSDHYGIEAHIVFEPISGLAVFSSFPDK